MLVKFTIASVEESSRQQEYESFSLGGPHGLRGSGIKTRTEYEYKITASDSRIYWLFDQGKPRMGLHKGVVIYGNAREMRDDGGERWGKYAGGFRLEHTRHPVIMDAIETPQKFALAKKAQLELSRKQKDNLEREIARLEQL